MDVDQHEVTRSVEVDASPDAVWEALADPELRGSWLDDDDTVDRVMRLDRSEPGSSLTWTWWHAEDPAGASRVEIALTELDTGRTRVAVTERLVAGPGAATMTARASAAAPAIWDRRLFGLELLLLTAGICVA